MVQIGTAGPRAPVFDVVARPNAWQKQVKESVAPAAVSPVNAARQDFFAEVLTEVAAARPGIRMPKKQKGSWISFASGPFGYWCISIINDGRCQVEAYLDTGDKTLNKLLFDDMAGDADRWATATGLPLSWQRLDDRRASRIAAHHDPFPLGDPAIRATAKAWAVGTILAMHDALDQTLRSRTSALRRRQRAAANEQDDPGEPHGR